MIGSAISYSSSNDRLPEFAAMKFARCLFLLSLGILCFAQVCLAQSGVDATPALKELGGQVKQADGQITEISFNDCKKLGVSEFELISQQAKLKKLTLYNGCKGLNNETLPLLTKLMALEELNTDGIQVSDDGLKPLGEMKSLRSMSFFHPSWGSQEFVGSGLLYFADLLKLELLTIAGSPFDDAGMAAVGKLTQLREFNTWHTFQIAAGNQHLLKLTNLKSIRLGQRLRKYDGKPAPPSLSDETLTIVAQLTSLENIWLDEARFSLMGLQKLQALKELKKLTLERVDISDADVEQLKKGLPQVSIDVKPMTAEQRQSLTEMLKP